MSSMIEVQPAEKSAAALPWALWGRQVAAILRLEVKKNFLGKRAFLIYLLALLPVLLVGALVILAPNAQADISRNFGQANIVYANIYEGLVLRTVVFFGCAWIFMNLFRGEIVDKSLHYYFLAAVRREVLLAGKYLSGLVTSIILFLGSTAGSLFFIYMAKGYPANVEYIFDGPGLKQITTYLGVTALGCLGYGAFFLVIGLFFRNPMIPAAVLYVWESINFLLPPLLKKVSVIHYLHSLMPVPVSEGPFAMVAEPTPAWVSVPGLLAVTGVVLVFASYRIRRMEIRYGGD